MAWIVDQDTCRATVFISMKTTDQPEETLKPNNFFQKMMISSKKDYTHFVWNFGHTWYINKTKNYLVAKWAVIFEKWLRHVRPSKLNNCSRSKATGLMFLSQRNFQTICLCSFQGNEDQSHDIQNQRCFAHYTPMSISDCEMLGSSGSEAEEENVRK